MNAGHVVLGAAAVTILGYLGYEAYQSRKTREKVTASQLGVLNLAPIFAIGVSKQFLVTPSVGPDVAGSEGPFGAWADLQFINGHRVFFNRSPIAGRGGQTSYQVYLDDPTPCPACVEIVRD
jgi:hypothetical protein